MTDLTEVIAAELERPRPLPAQVVQHLEDVHEVLRGEAAAFLANQLGSLEEYEVDLILSPVFTPSLEDQAVVAGFLAARAVAEADWPALIASLLARPTRAHLRTEDGQTVEIRLPEIILERYVRRLRLQGGLPEEILAALQPHPASSRPLLCAIARRAIWSSPARREILARFLRVPATADTRADAIGLLRLVETYEPADRAEFLARLPQWRQALRQEAAAAGAPRPFFNERVEDLHGGGRDQRAPETTRGAGARAQLALLDRLAGVLAD